MTKYEVLNQLNQKELKTKEAYSLLYDEPKQRKPRQAGFIKCKIRIPENRGITVLLGFLFLLPIPLFIVKMVLRKKLRSVQISEKIPLSADEIIQLISYRGIKVDVSTSDHVKVLIKTI